MFDTTEIKSEISLLGVVGVAVKLNNLGKLLVQKGVITEEEFEKLSADAAKETAEAFLED